MEFGQTIHGEFPPTDGWPAPVADLADELTDLYERKTAADRRLLELVGNDTTSTRDTIAARLEQEDSAALVAATRAGKSTEKIGRPAAEQYGRDVATARRDVLAVDAAIVAVTADLVEAMKDHRDDLLGVSDGLAVDGHTVFTEAVKALDAARTRLYEADAMRLFIDTTTLGNPWRVGRIIFHHRPPNELTGPIGFHVPPWPQMLQYLNAEADAMRPPATDATDDTTDPDDTTGTTTTTDAAA